jgi:hypothetical protein
MTIMMDDARHIALLSMRAGDDGAVSDTLLDALQINRFRTGQLFEVCKHPRIGFSVPHARKIVEALLLRAYMDLTDPRPKERMFT